MVSICDEDDIRCGTAEDDWSLCASCVRKLRAWVDDAKARAK